MEQREHDEQEFDFIKEKIKDKPINRRRLLIRMIYNLLCAVVFGVAACFVFVLLKPSMEEWLYPEKESTINIPKDDLPVEQDSEKKEDEPQKEEESKKEEEEPKAPEKVVVQKLELEDYQKLQDKLYAIG